MKYLLRFIKFSVNTKQSLSHSVKPIIKNYTNMNIAIIGSGFSALSAACYLAKEGHKVTVLEKNNYLGGRARQLQKEGFTFDMGPTWYWMPDVFEKFFNDFGKKTSDYYQLEKLNPAYQVYFGKKDSVIISGEYDEIKNTFESIEKGSGDQLDLFMKDAANNYEIAIKDLVYRPGVSPLELVTPKTVTKLGHFISNIRRDVGKLFQSQKLRSILEFPVLFLGAKPSNTPGFYNFMNYADFVMGTWHPMGGMYQVVNAMVDLGKELGVTYMTDCAVDSINVTDKKVKNISSSKGTFDVDLVVSGADYAHSETLLPKEYRSYSENYWDKKTFAPSSLLFYVGLTKPLENVQHHTLFFDSNFDDHAVSIYDKPEWPENPLFYASFSSKTDLSLAPSGMESATFLIPLAVGLEDNEALREKYFNHIIDRLEMLTEQSVRDKIIFKESFCVKDFIDDYNSYKGNAYGMANTLLQTAFLRPKIKSPKVDNLYFTGQLTVPGPGVPPSIISGKIVSDLIHKHHQS